LAGDLAFEAGAGSNKEIFLPFPGFGDDWYRAAFPDAPTRDPRTVYARIPSAAFALARECHLHPTRFPTFRKITQQLLARDGLQILGRDLKTPSQFVVCWTPDGCCTDAERSDQTGGTGQAISVADAAKIPIFNLARPEHRERLERFVAS
jgi:hypothetical protein